jgi:Flp pilus assembly protein TadD
MLKFRWWAALFALAFSVIMAAPASAAWKRAESANFILYSQASESTIRDQIALLEDYQAFLRLLTQIDDPPAANKLSIYMVKGPAQLRSVHRVPEGVAGFYTANSGGIAAFADESAAGRGEQRNQILLHEIAHHFMLQYRPLPYPAWYVEGFAEYVMTTQFEKGEIEFGAYNPGRAYTLTQGKWLPLERVLFGGVPTDGEEMAAFYAQSWLIAHYMMRSNVHRPKLAAYISKLAGGEDARKAFDASFPEPLAELEAALRAYVKRGMTFSRLKRNSAAVPPAMTITPLPASADDLLLAQATLRRGADDGTEATLLAKVRTAAAKHGDPYAKRVLAHAEAQYGDGAKADALLDELIAGSPKDAELLYLRGLRHLVEARASEDGEAGFKEAQRWFARAHKLDPNHFQTLIRYAESLQVDRRMVSDNTINILLLARELAPQVSETAMNAAGLLIARGRFAEAEGLLLPLTGNPHNTGLAAAAKAMLERARTEAKRPAEAEDEAAEE